MTIKKIIHTLMWVVVIAIFGYEYFKNHLGFMDIMIMIMAYKINRIEDLLKKTQSNMEKQACV